jgi:hypothetical protein
MSNIEQGMSDVQVWKRSALLIIKKSKWQNTLLGNWKLDIGH